MHALGEGMHSCFPKKPEEYFWISGKRNLIQRGFQFSLNLHKTVKLLTLFTFKLNNLTQSDTIFP